MRNYWFSFVSLLTIEQKEEKFPTPFFVVFAPCDRISECCDFLMWIPVRWEQHSDSFIPHLDRVIYLFWLGSILFSALFVTKESSAGLGFLDFDFVCTIFTTML